MSGNQPIDAILGSLNAINTACFSDDEVRNQALLAVYALISRLETPWETVQRLCMNQPALEASLKVVKDLQLFPKWHEQGDFAKDSKSLAEMVECQSELLTRILRQLATNHVIEEVPADTFQPTRFSLALLDPTIGEWISFLLHQTAGVPQIHTLQKSNTPLESSFQLAKEGLNGDLFKYYAENPEQGASSNKVQSGVVTHQSTWLNGVPASSILDGAENDPTSPLFVNVGGNIGHDLENFRHLYPHTAERLYLQDLPSLFNSAKTFKVPKTVNVMAHNFFTSQPIMGARVYYLHGILHDWADEHAATILSMLKAQ